MNHKNQTTNSAPIVRNYSIVFRSHDGKPFAIGVAPGLSVHSAIERMRRDNPECRTLAPGVSIRARLVRS